VYTTAIADRYAASAWMSELASASSVTCAAAAAIASADPSEPFERLLDVVGPVGMLVDAGDADPRVADRAPGHRDDGRDPDDRIPGGRLGELPIGEAGALCDRAAADGHEDLIRPHLRSGTDPRRTHRAGRPARRRPAQHRRGIERQRDRRKSDAGSAWAIEPPIVPRLRTWTSAISSTASATPGNVVDACHSA
jgi:hypothetical protein